MTPLTLRQLRERAGLSQVQVATAVEIGDGSVSAWETGTAPLPAARVEALAAALGASVAEVVSAAELLISDRETFEQRTRRLVRSRIIEAIDASPEDWDTTLRVLRQIAASKPGWLDEADHRAATRMGNVTGHARFIVGHLQDPHVQ